MSDNLSWPNLQPGAVRLVSQKPGVRFEFDGSDTLNESTSRFHT